MGQELGDPLRVLHVGLAPRHCLDMRRIEQPHLARAFQDVENRLPVLSRAFKPDMRAAARREPVSQAQQFAGGRAKGLRLRQALAVRIRRETTDHNCPLVHIDARAAREDQVHNAPPPDGPHRQSP